MAEFNISIPSVDLHIATQKFKNKVLCVKCFCGFTYEIIITPKLLFNVPNLFIILSN